MAQNIKYEYLLFAFFVGFLLHCALKSRNNLEGMGVCVSTDDQDFLESCGRIEYPSDSDANCGDFGECEWKDCGSPENLPKGCARALNSGNPENNDCIDKYFIDDAKEEMEAHNSLHPTSITAHFSDSDDYTSNDLKWGQGACGAPKLGWYIDENNHIPYPCKKQPGCQTADYTESNDWGNRCNNLAESILSKDFYKCANPEATESMDHNGVISAIACQSQDHCETISADNTCIDISGISYRKCDTGSDGYYSNTDGRVQQCTPIDNAKNGYKIKCNDETDSKFDEDKMTQSDGKTKAQRSSDSDPSDFCADGYELKIASGSDNNGTSDICVEKDGFPWWGWLLIILGVLVVIVAVLWKIGFFSKIEKSSAQ